MINHIVLVGRLVADPEIRYTQSGIAVGNFCMAVNRQFKNQAGEKEADFINVVVWRKLAELCGQYISKGKLVGVEGRLQSRKYQDKDGNNRTSFDVVADNVQFLEPRPSGSSSPPSASGPGPGQESSPMPEPPPENSMEDDLPF